MRANPRASALLAYVVEKAIEGRASEIKQTTIGLEVFGRPASYDPRRDSVVRSVARQLRDKLNEYYLNGGAGDPLRLELPKGSYVPVFTQLNPEQLQSSSRRIPPPRAPIGIAAVLAICLVLVLSGDHDGERRRITREAAGTAAPLYRAGRQALLDGDFVGARRPLESAAALAPKDAPIHASLANDLMALGYNSLALDEARTAEAFAGRLSRTDELEVEATFRMASGDFKAAVTAFAELVRQHPGRIEYNRGLAQAQQAAGQSTDCLRGIARAKQTAPAASTDALLSIAEAHCRAGVGDYLGALEPARRAVVSATARGQREIYARARLLESGLMMSTDPHQDFIAPREEARRICAEIGDDSCTLRALRVKANSDLWQMRPAVALAAYRAALPLARKMGSVKEIPELLDGEGNALMLMDDFAAARAAFEDALATAQRSGYPGVGARQDMAELALRQGQIDRAVILAEEAENDARAIADHLTEAHVQVLKARALFQRGDYKSSAAILDQVRHDIGSFHLRGGAPRVWRLAHASLSRAMGKLDAAAADLDATVDFDGTSGDYEYQLARLQLLLAQQRYGEAVETAHHTLAFVNGSGNRSACILVTALLSDAYGLSGRMAEARETANAARTMLSEHTAPLSRTAALSSAARWAQPALEAGLRNR
jgi:tetratricopeptide (TPR) repeat protein